MKAVQKLSELVKKKNSLSEKAEKERERSYLAPTKLSNIRFISISRIIPRQELISI